MPTIQRFEDLECWKEARKLTNTIYTLLETCRDFWYRDQIQRAAVSVMNNIAEGFGRTTIPDKIHFFIFATSSLFEVRSMIYLGMDRKYFTVEDGEDLLKHNQMVMDLTFWFLKYLHSLKKIDTPLNKQN